PSPFDEAACITFDGTGESESGILGMGDATGVRILKTIPRRESWGYLYGHLTERLGFVGHRDEGKVMGLAAYGTPDPDRFTFIDWDREIPRIDKKRFKRFLQDLPTRKPGEDILAEHMDLASTLQAAFERGLNAMAEWLASKTGARNLCLAGGCALNCAANGALLRGGRFEKIFVQPASHDAGTALGSAFAVYRRVTGTRPPVRFHHAFFGPAFTSGEVLRTLETSRWKQYERLEDPGPKAAEWIADGKVVGWVQNRMEVGPRALGARSLLADPRHPSMRDRVNRIKGREPWRPLAPTILACDAPTFLRERTPSPFMLFAFTATPTARDKIPAVVHVDGTVRAQVLEPGENPKFHSLLTRFKELTGVGAVLNTSFNAQGEPIVCSPRDALQTFFSMGIDALVLQDYFIWK
ncbi:MAG: carbamoyltransferase family protein, partial [Planctomycetota bacterium]